MSCAFISLKNRSPRKREFLLKKTFPGEEAPESVREGGKCHIAQGARYTTRFFLVCFFFV